MPGAHNVRVNRGCWLVLGVVLAGCAATDGSSGEGDAIEPEGNIDALSNAKCDVATTALYFHGKNFGGASLGGSGVCAPRIPNTGDASFWSDVAYVDAPSSTVVTGYSAGRIPMLRRLARDEASETTAVMLDGSWADGPRFDDRTGPEIVDTWLAGDPDRRFVLVYLRSSMGWNEYVALTKGEHAQQIRTCEATGTHAGLPALVTRDLLKDPDAWLAKRCPNGKLK